MNKELPSGFKSWVELHDYLVKNRPKINTRTRFKMHIEPKYDYENNVSTPQYYEVEFRTVQLNCWREINELRIGQPDTFLLINLLNRIESQSNGKHIPKEIEVLLTKLAKKLH